MPLIEISVSRRTTVAVGVVLAALFGSLSLRAIPVQLAPGVTQPETAVTTRRAGASPQEVEREIVRRQDDPLESVQGVAEMTSGRADSRRSELCRGIGTPVAGSLALSTVFTLFPVPGAMSLFLDLARLFRRAPA